jgi:hypothetical protein
VRVGIAGINIALLWLTLYITQELPNLPRAQHSTQKAPRKSIAWCAAVLRRLLAEQMQRAFLEYDSFFLDAMAHATKSTHGD